MSVDIIIPVYNALKDLQICLQSVYKYTDLNINRLILVNDNSPDVQIKPYLDSQKRKNVIIIHNKKNMGFSNNINLGMGQSEENDVVLLNSDTIVTRNWIEKIEACAYSSHSIGTVTPLSNNATLCSVPDFCEENTLPDGMSVDQAAAIVEACSMKKYPRITVANGFCMFIKREVIQTVGNFDAEAFGRGYGEENDFCNRAEQMGYIHVMCDNAYIYHSGTRSFVSNEKKNYVKAHDDILQRRYPIQMHNNALHCQNNPNGWVGQNIKYYFDIWKGRKNILYLLQSDFKEGAEDNVGGTQLHVKHLARGLCSEMNVFVAARDKEYLQITAYTEKNEYTFRFYIGKREEFPPLRSRRLAEIFRLILAGFRIHLVHVHHTASTSLDIYYEAKKLNIPIVFTVHDFYYICPCEKLLDLNGNVCIGKENHICSACLEKKFGIYKKNNFLKNWRKKHSEILKLCNQIIVPSESAKEMFGLCYPECCEKVQTIEHGIDAPKLLEADEKNIIYTNDLIWKIEEFNNKSRCPYLAGVAYLSKAPDVRYKVILKIRDCKGKTVYLPANFDRNLNMLQYENKFHVYIPNNLLSDGKIKISVILMAAGAYYMNKKKEEVFNITFRNKAGFRMAFLGGINEEKGRNIISNIVKKGPTDVEWYIIGEVDKSGSFHLRQDNLIETGCYHQEDLSTYLKFYEIDAVGILSKWPETFSYTLSEAVVNHIPVIVTKIGAHGQRVMRDRYGETVSADEENAIKEVINIVNKWKTKGKTYQEIKKKACQYNHADIRQMLQKYKSIYDQETPSKNCENICIDGKDRERLYQAYVTDNGIDGDDRELLSRIKILEDRMKYINNNATIKFMLKITSIQFPFKQKIRKFLLEHM